MLEQATRSLTGSLLLLMLSAATVSGCHKQAAEAPEAAVTVQAAHPVVGPISEEIEADATLAPLAQAALAPRISAPIRAEYVQRGDHVHRGQLLVTLENRDAQGAALDSQGALTSAKAAYTTATQATIPDQLLQARLDVDQTRAALDVASTTAAERQRLFQQGALSGREADAAAAARVQAQVAYDTARQRLASVTRTLGSTTAANARGQLTAARGRLESATAQASYGLLRSPINGVVTERPLFPGETAPAGTPVITVMDTSSLLAKLHLAQAAAQKLAVGGEAAVDVPGMKEPVPATISFISPALDPGSTTIEVWLRLLNPGGQLKVGTPVHAVIRGHTLPNALQIPTAAVLPGSEGGSAVMLAGPEGKAHRRAVTVGVRTPETVQILQGLSPSDNVIVEGGFGLDNGTAVTVGGKPAAGGNPD